MEIKETKELLVGVETVVLSGLDIAKDGLGVDDVAKAIELVKKSDVIIAAVKGVDQVDEELKDLDEKELIELGLASYGMIKKIVAAVKELDKK